MESTNDNNQTKIVKVKITTQQHPLLDRVIAEGDMGKTESQVLRNVFLVWAKARIEKERDNEKQT